MENMKTVRVRHNHDEEGAYLWFLVCLLIGVATFAMVSLSDYVIYTKPVSLEAR